MANVFFDLAEHDNYEEIMAAIDQIEDNYMGGPTNTAEGLQEVANKV